MTCTGSTIAHHFYISAFVPKKFDPYVARYYGSVGAKSVYRPVKFGKCLGKRFLVARKSVEHLSNLLYRSGVGDPLWVGDDGRI